MVRSVTPRPFPKAEPHGELRELFDGVFFVTGSLRMGGPLPMRFSRNMTVVRDGKSLTLLNSLRLDDAGLAALDALGKVEHVIRVAAFHGMDDPFYKDRYGAKVWAVEGSAYVSGFGGKPSAGGGYFEPDVWMTPETELPIPNASLFRFETATPSEGMIVLDRDGGILVPGDCLQNWAGPDAYFSFPAKIVMRLMGFFAPYSIGPGWLKAAKPDARELEGILALDFEHVLPAHGAEVIGGAKEKYRPAIERTCAKLRA
jgi:hypothetical protein